jgi:hypothetical protein
MREQLAKHGVGVEYDFVRGAGRRLELLAGGAPRVALLSRGAAVEHGAFDDPAFLVLDLGQRTYYSEQTLVVLARAGLNLNRRERIKVARDSDSFDHTQLTKREFPDQPNIEYIECSFPDVPGAILEGRADVGVWHQVVTSITPQQAGLELRPVRWLSNDLQLMMLSRGVLVWRSEFGEIKELLRLLDLSLIRKEQARLAATGIQPSEVRRIVPWM